MKKRRSILMIMNPASNCWRGARKADEVAAYLRAMGVEVTVEQTAGPGDAGTLTQHACGSDDQSLPPDCIVSCGGDGTIQEVAGTLARIAREADAPVPPLGIVPAGRCNDFSRALGLPTDSRVLAETIGGGESYPIDLGKVNGRYFCTVATAGIDAEVSRFVDTMRLPIKGTVAYVYGAVRVLMRYRAPSFRIAGDFGLIEGRFFLASSANTSSYGGAIPIAPEAVPTDGLLDLCIIDEVSRLRALTFVPRAMRGRHAGEPEVRFVRTKALTLESEEPMELWADGERIGETPAHIEIAPGAVSVVLPADPRTTCGTGL